MSQNDLTHFDDQGRARMVDISPKAETARRARAEGFIRMGQKTLDRIMAGGMAKGDVIAIAEIAAITGAKQTSALIPLCHPLPLSAIRVTISPAENSPALRVVVEASSTGRTGVEMEALTGVSIACLTIYDMVKAIDKAMIIDGVCLLEKTGGKSGDWSRAQSAGPAQSSSKTQSSDPVQVRTQKGRQESAK